MADQAATPMCSKCNTTVRPKQQILECDRCLRFLHRTCVPTSMTQQQYHTAKKAGIRIGFQCPGSCPEWNLPLAPVVASNPGDPLALPDPAAPRAIPIEAGINGYNPDDLPHVLTELLPPTTDHVLNYIPEDDADLCIQPREDPFLLEWTHGILTGLMRRIFQIPYPW